MFDEIEIKQIGTEEKVDGIFNTNSNWATRTYFEGRSFGTEEKRHKETISWQRARTIIPPIPVAVPAMRVRRNGSNTEPILLTLPALDTLFQGIRDHYLGAINVDNAPTEFKHRGNCYSK